MKCDSSNFMSVAKRTPASKRTSIDSYTGEWQEALRPRRLPEVGEVVTIAEDGDAREWHDFRNAIDHSGMVVLMTGRQDRDGDNIGVVVKRLDKHGDETLIW